MENWTGETRQSALCNVPLPQHVENHSSTVSFQSD